MIRLYVGPGVMEFVTVLEHSDLAYGTLRWEMGNMFKMNMIRMSITQNRGNLTMLRFKLSIGVSPCIIIQVFICCFNI